MTRLNSARSLPVARQRDSAGLAGAIHEKHVRESWRLPKTLLELQSKHDIWRLRYVNAI